MARDLVDCGEISAQILDQSPQRTLLSQGEMIAKLVIIMPAMTAQQTNPDRADIVTGDMCTLITNRATDADLAHPIDDEVISDCAEWWFAGLVPICDFTDHPIN